MANTANIPKHIYPVTENKEKERRKSEGQALGQDREDSEEVGFFENQKSPARPAGRALFMMEGVGRENRARVE